MWTCCAKKGIAVTFMPLCRGPRKLRRASRRLAPGSRGDAFEHDIREPRGQAGGDGDWDPGRGEQYPWQDLTVHRADDQQRGGVDVGGRVDPPEALLTLEISGQQASWPTTSSSTSTA